MMSKLALLKTSTDSIGTRIHPGESQYIVINSDDSPPLLLQNIEIKRTETYNYLGTWISNASIADQEKNHLKANTNQTLKFA